MKLKPPWIAFALALALVLFLAPKAKADTLRPTATQAAVADTVTTAVALRLPGVVETNPAGFAGTIVGKVIVLSLIDEQDDATKKQADHIVSAIWTGAAVNNALVILGSTAALPIGIITFFILFFGE